LNTRQLRLRPKAGGTTVTAVATVALAVLSAACSNLSASSAGSTGGGTDASYTITLSGDRSGPYAEAGTADMNGFQAYVDGVNDKGGVNGHKISLKVLDDQSDVPTALANYQQTLSSDSLGFFEQNDNNVANAIGAKAQQDGIAVSSIGGFHSGVGVYPYNYTMGPTAAQFFATIAKFASVHVKKTAGATAEFIAYDDANTETYAKPLGAALATEGIKLVGSQLVPTTSIDLTLAASNFAAKHPALVVTALQDGAPMISMVTGLRAHGYTGPIINFDSNVGDATMKKLNDPQVYLIGYTADSADTSNPAVETMLSVAAKHGLTAGSDQYFYVNGYMLAKLVVQAIGTCGDSCTRKSFNSALENTKTSGDGLMAGTIGFSPTDHDMVSSLIIDQWDGTKGYLVPIAGFGF
jgi:branched-chain amino acid transport system substrate-binding protein